MTTHPEQVPILIVEDDPATAELEQRALRRAGMSAQVVGRVREALAALQVQRFSAIVLDFSLPDGNSWQIVEAAAALTPRVPVVIVTAQGNERVASEAIHRGVADYVQKSEAFWNELPGILDRVTRLAKAEEGLRRLEDFFERARLGAAVIDHEGRLERVNRAFAEMHGYDSEALIGKPLSELWAPAQQAKISGRYATIQARGALRFEAEHVRRDGSVFPVLVDATHIADAGASQLYMAAYVQDVTDQKRAASELRASEERARAVADAIPDIMLRLDAHGLILDYQAGLSTGEAFGGRAAVGSSLREQLPAAVADELLQQLSAALQSRELRRCEFTLNERDSARDYEARMVVCGADQVILIARDITQAREAERTIRASLHEKEVLLQELNHRVKNNLQVISSMVALQMRQMDTEAGREALLACQTRVLAIALVHEKLHQALEYGRVSFAEYATSLAEGVYRLCLTSRAPIALELAIADVEMPVDKAIPCGLILNELIANALKHAFPGGRSGRIRIELRPEDPARLLLLVSDDGVGIPDLDLERVESLGLQLVATLTEQIGGSLEVRRGSGSVFLVRIPVG